MSGQDGSSIGSKLGLSLSRRQVLGALAVSGAAGASGAMLARDDDPFDGDPGGGGSSSDGGVVYPIATDAGDHCLGADDEEYDTVGSGAANWFHVGDCGSWKEYAVDPGLTYRVVAYVDECFDEASFVIEEEHGGGWEPVRTVESDVSSTTNDQINERSFVDNAEEMGIRLRAEPTHEVIHSPDSTKMRIRSTADWDGENEPGSYVTVYEWPLLSRSSTKSVGPEPFTVSNVPGHARPRDDTDYFDTDHELYVERPNEQVGHYRFEYEGWGSQSVVLLKREVTQIPENEPWVIYWFELTSQFTTVRTDSPADREKWADGEKSYQLLPPSEEMIENADADLDHLRDLEPPMTIPTHAINASGYEVRVDDPASLAGYAERITFNEPYPGFDYTGMVQMDPEERMEGVRNDLIDIWEPTPDVPTSSGEFALQALTDDERFVEVGGMVLGIGEEYARYSYSPLDWAMSFAETAKVLSRICREDTALTDDEETGEKRTLEVLHCDKGMGVQNAIVQVAHKLGAGGTVEFESTFTLDPETLIDKDRPFDDHEITFTHSFDLPTDVPREFDRRACFDAPRPVVTFDPEPPVEAGTVVTLDGSESTVKPDLSVEVYEWKIRPPRPEGVEEDPDHESHLAGETVEYEFQAEGTYEIELAVTDTEGRTGTETVEFEVERASMTDDGAALEIEGAGRKKDHERAEETIAIGENAPLELEYDVTGSFERGVAGVSAFTRVVENPGTDDERVIFQVQRALRRDFEYRLDGEALRNRRDGEGLGADEFDERVRLAVEDGEARLFVDGERRVSTEVTSDYGGEIGIEYKVQIDKPNDFGRVSADWSAVSLASNDGSDESDESGWIPW